MQLARDIESKLQALNGEEDDEGYKFGSTGSFPRQPKSTAGGKYVMGSGQSQMGFSTSGLQSNNSTGRSITRNQGSGLPSGSCPTAGSTSGSSNENQS